MFFRRALKTLIILQKCTDFRLQQEHISEGIFSHCSANTTESLAKKLNLQMGEVSEIMLEIALIQSYETSLCQCTAWFGSTLYKQEDVEMSYSVPYLSAITRVHSCFQSPSRVDVF